MLREDQNSKENLKSHIKDTTSLPMTFNQGSFYSKFSNKINKLITALYMVTDIIDKEEPLRNKLRTLGTDIISDMHSAPHNIGSKITQVMSFLDIARAMNIISEMNCGILRKEFLHLDQSIKESIATTEPPNQPIDLSEFFTSPPAHLLNNERGDINSKGHTRIGVQKGSTLMKALSNKTGKLSNRLSNITKVDFDLLKKERRFNIVTTLKNLGGSANIKDILSRIGKGVGVTPTSEKTLQRELMSMTKDSVLKKTGKKRWSRYSLK